MVSLDLKPILPVRFSPFLSGLQLSLAFFFLFIRTIPSKYGKLLLKSVENFELTIFDI